MSISQCLRPFFSALLLLPALVAGLHPARAEAADVLVAIASSGADAKSRVAGPMLREGRSFVADGDAAADDLGSGTALAEIVAESCAGLAVRILPLRIASAKAPDPAPEALAAAVDAAVEAGADVLLVACVSGRRNAAVAAALDRALKKGLLVLSPAGSSPDGFDLFPASHPGVLSVAGVEPAPASSPQALPWRLTAFANASARTDVLAPALDPERDLFGSGVAAARAAAFAAAALAQRSDVPREKRREWLLGLGDGAVAGRDAAGKLPRVWDPAALKAALARDAARGRFVVESVIPETLRSVKVRVRNVSAAAAKGTLRLYSALLREPVTAAIPETAPGAAATLTVEIGEDAAMTRCVEIAGAREDDPPADVARFETPVRAWAGAVSLAGVEVLPPDEGARTVRVRVFVANASGETAEGVRILVGLGAAERTRTVAAAAGAVTTAEIDVDIPAPGASGAALPLLVELGSGAEAAARGGNVPAGAGALRLEPPPVRK